MARKPRKTSSKLTRAIDVKAAPDVDGALVAIVTLPLGTRLHRIHSAEYGPGEFNPGTFGNARFSPIQTVDGDPIPTMYAGENFDCAAMETVFHDVPITPGLKTLDLAKFSGQVHSVLEAQDDLKLLDLRTKSLRKIGLQRKDLIDTEKDDYPRTRAIGAALHHQRKDAQGLLWTSRQDDSAKAVVLFGDRLGMDVLVAAGIPRDLDSNVEAYDALVELADRIGVLIVKGK
jgi:hypothetical protein